MPNIAQWNNRYQPCTNIPSPCQVLATYTHLLPKTGTALDLACGLGANALLLARHGLKTHAWDYAQEAIEHLQNEAKNQQISIDAQVRDVVISPPSPKTYDVIVVCHFLDRKLAPFLIQALKPNGLLFYQTFIRTYVNNTGPQNPAFRLIDNELLYLFNYLQTIVYKEEGNIGDLTQGFRDEALLIAKKRKN